MRRRRKRILRTFETLEDRRLLACMVAENTCFAAIGDYGEAGPKEAAVASLVKGWNPDFIITLGDNNYPNGSASTIDANIGQYYHDYIYPYVGSYGPGADTNKFFPSLGNHDWITSGAQPYLDYFELPGNERYYKFTKGPVDFFVVDSDSHEPDGHESDSVQAAWLQSELAASTAPWKLVYQHHAPYSSGTHGGSSSRRWPFEKWGATTVLAGHEHNYERINRNGFPYFVNGSAGRSLRGISSRTTGNEVFYSGDHGAMLIEANESQIQFQFIAVGGEIIDTYTILAPGNSLPLVEITTTEAIASEFGEETAALEVSRTGDLSESLTIEYSVSGTATETEDYTSLSGTLNIPSGASSASIIVDPLDDRLAEGLETVQIRLSAAAAYELGLNSTAGVTINDDELVKSTLEVRVSASSDDAEERPSGTIRRNSGDLEFVSDRGVQTIGMRFNSIDIPRGVTIQHAYIQFQVDEKSVDSTFLQISAEATDSASTFSSTKANISNRVTTANRVSWSPPAWASRGEAGENQRTPDLSAIIQEVVDRPGWVARNSVALIATGTGKRVAESFDGNAKAAPLLHLEYTVTKPSDNVPPHQNHAPALALIGTQVVAAQSRLTFTAKASDQDESTDSLFFSLDSGAPAGSRIDPVTGVFEWTPNADQAPANYQATVRVSDDGDPSLSDFQIVTILVTESSTDGNTIRVPHDQASIQAAIDSATDGDTVLVYPGHYAERLVLAGKTITLASLFHTTGDRSYIDQTIIDGGGKTVIKVESSVGSETQIVGFTIQDGNDGISASGELNILSNHLIGHADGIDFENGGGGVVRDNLIENNGDDAIDLDHDVDVVIERNILRNNDDDGIEIRLHDGGQTALEIVIRDNVISGNGEDGIQLIDYSRLSGRVFWITGNVIQDNDMAGLGLMNDADTNEDYRAASIRERVYLFNNTFTGNQYGVTGGDNLVAINNLFVNNSLGGTKQVDGDSIAAYNLYWNNGVDDQGSNLVLPTTSFADPLLDSGNHLQSGSPAIDSGVASYVISGETVIDLPNGEYVGIAPDLGAMENDGGLPNQPPTSSQIAPVIGREDAANILVDLFEAFDDSQDEGHRLTYSVLDNSNASLFTATTIDSRTGTLTLDLAAEANGVAELTLRATDTGGLFAETNLMVTVEEVNDTPVRTSGEVADLVVDDAATTPLGLAGLAYRPGGSESAQRLVYQVTAIPSPEVGDILLADGTTVVSLGQYTLAELDGMQFRPTPGHVGDRGSFSFVVTDDGTTAGLPDPRQIQESLRVSVRDSSPAPNTAPTTSGIPDIDVSENGPDITVDLFEAFQDVQTDDSALVYSVVANSNPALFRATAIDVQSGILTLQLEPDAHGAADFRVRATDVGGLFVEAALVITVSEVSDPPVRARFSLRNFLAVGTSVVPSVIIPEAQQFVESRIAPIVTTTSSNVGPDDFRSDEEKSFGAGDFPSTGEQEITSDPERTTDMSHEQPVGDSVASNRFSLRRFLSRGNVADAHDTFFSDFGGQE